MGGIDGEGKPAPEGALGGSRNERGGEYRAFVGALLASCVLRNESLAAVQLRPISGKAALLEAEGDKPVDDLIVETDESHRAYIQAKASAGLTRGATPFAKALRQFARALEAGLGDGDFLVLACGDATQPLRKLGRLLDRSRLTSRGSPEPKEARALAAFREIVAAVAPEVDPDALLDRLVIWETDPSRGDGRTALVGRLEPRIAADGFGAQAARELADTTRHLAVMRGGYDALGLVGELVIRKVQLSSSAPSSSPAQQGTALARHRERVRMHGETLRLLGVSGRLADIPFEAADAEIKVDVPEDDSRLGRDPVLALRRRGRALLVGRPGGGKSTALRSMGAHWAARPDWPIPIAVHLRRLARSESGLTAALLDAATDELAGNERVALRGALEHELARGRCLLLLDGLDEVRQGRRVFVAELSAWLRDLHPDVEIVVASRPVALADAATLDLPSLELREPDSPNRTASAILDAAAAQAADGEDKEDWIAQRLGWLTAVFERNHELSATPLIVVLLALAAARSETVADLPSRRALALQQSVEDVLRDWEVEARRRGEVAIGPLAGERAVAALRIGFFLLGEQAIEESPPIRTEVSTALSTRLADHFELARGNADAAASDAIVFWEEAGLFSFDQALAANVRSLAELGYAWPVAESEPEQQQQWISTIRQDEDRWPCLSLAAGLSNTMADAWAQALATDGSAAELAALLGAYRDGATFALERLRAVGLAMTDSALADKGEAEETAWALVELPLDTATRQRLRPLLAQAVPAPRKLIVEVWAIVRWDERGKAADDCLRTLLRSPEPPPPWKEEEEEEEADRPAARMVLDLRIDAHYYDAFRESALRLAAGRRSDAELVISALEEKTDFEFSGRLRAALKRGGHEDLQVPAWQRPSFKGFAEPGEFAAAERKMLGWVAENASPALLAWSERRRLTEIVDLWETFRANWISPGWPLDRPATAKAWIEAAIVLGGFDRARLTADARQVLSECDRGDDVTAMLFDGGEARPLTGWSAVEAPVELVEQLIGTIGRASRQVTATICRALVSAPEKLGVADLLAARIDELRAWSRWFAAITLLNIAPDPEGLAREWQTSDDPLLRSPAAMWWSSNLDAHGSTEGEVLRALSDADAGVRAQAVEELPKTLPLSSHIRDRLEEMSGESRGDWRCVWCGTDNDGGNQAGCVKCHSTGPEPSRDARERLGQR